MPKVRREPYRVHIVGPAYAHGGTEQHTCALAKFLDPRRVQIERVYVTNDELWSRDATEPHGCAVEYCPPEDLSLMTSSADAVLHWGIDMNRWLQPSDTQARIHVAHGCSDWSQSVLDGSRLVTDCVACVSSHVRDSLHITLPTATIPNGIDTARLTESQHRDITRDELGWSDSHTVIGTVSRLASDKRIENIIHALALLQERYVLLVCGDGPAGPQLHADAQAYIPGRARWIKTENYMGDVYRSMDYYVSASQHEGFGLSMAEAMWSGIPLITTETGLAAGHKDPQNFLTLTDGTPKDIAEKIINLDGNCHGTSIRTKKAKQHADHHFHARRMAAQYGDLIETVIESKLRSRPA